MSKLREHDRGQEDGAIYKKQGVIDRICNPRFDPRGGPKERVAYAKGHKHGRK